MMSYTVHDALPGPIQVLKLLMSPEMRQAELQKLLFFLPLSRWTFQSLE